MFVGCLSAHVSTLARPAEFVHSCRKLAVWWVEKWLFFEVVQSLGSSIAFVRDAPGWLSLDYFVVLTLSVESIVHYNGIVFEISSS